MTETQRRRSTKGEKNEKNVVHKDNFEHTIRGASS
jgi:hypothetical protein